MPDNLVAGTQFYFNAGRSKPGSWTKRGIVDKLTITPSGEIIEQEGPLPGHVGVIDVIELNRKLKFNVTVKQTDSLFWQLVFNSAALSPGSLVNFNPNGGGLIIGWSKFQVYDQYDVPRLNVEQLCAIRMPGGAQLGGKQITQADIDGTVIEDPLNVGSLMNLL